MYLARNGAEIASMRDTTLRIVDQQAVERPVRRQDEKRRKRRGKRKPAWLMNLEGKQI